MGTVILGPLLCIILTILGVVLGYEHFDPLEDGRKFSWREAFEKCSRHGGILLDSTSLSLSEETKEQKLLNGSDTWTPLQLVNGYIQEVTTHINYTDISNKLWEDISVWSEDTCIKLTTKHEFKAVKCSTRLPVVCHLQGLQSKVLECDKSASPILTVEVSGKSVTVQNGELNIRKSEQNDVSFHCSAFTEMSAIDWIKDGVYVNARKNIIYPARTKDPSKQSNIYSTQGTYWCEAWIPGCAEKYRSNKINLKFKGVVTVHLNLKKEQIASLDTADVLIKLKTLIQPSAGENILDFDVRRGYTSIGKQYISTYNFNIYLQAHNQENTFATNRKEFFNTRKLMLRKKRQTPPTNCPNYFKLQNTYCYNITNDDTWMNAYQNCFQYGIEKTPLDVKNYWSNQQFIDELIRNKVSSIWLAAERKIAGGPIYFSGPVRSDFNYNNYSATRDFNISWEKQNFSIKKKCLVLKIKQRTLNVVSCEEKFPFVCLFPSEFWTKNIVYDSFYEEDGDEEEIQWIEAKAQCKLFDDDNDLIDKANEIYNSTRDINSPNPVTYFIGRQNSALQNVNQSHVYTEWIQYHINTNSVFQKFKDGFIPGSSKNSNKTFACAYRVSHIQPTLNIVQSPGTTNKFTVGTLNTVELSLVFGIKCYLNGKLIHKDDRVCVIEIKTQGYFFCEALSHTPVKLITSNVIHVEFPDTISFVCEIFIGLQKYDFKLHDLTFQSEEVDGALFYEKLLQKKLQEFNVTVLNITENKSKSGTNIQFYIGMHAGVDQIKHYYNTILSLLQFNNDTDWASKNVTVNYLRNTKYCMSEVQELTVTVGCKSNVTWHDTRLNEMYECIQCNKVHKRNCRGTFMTGANWEQLITDDISDLSQNVPLCNDKGIVENAIHLLNTISYSKHNASSNMTASVTQFIHDFENILFRKEINETRYTDDTYVTIYSSTLKKNIHGYFLKKRDTFKTDSSGRFQMDVEAEDTISAVYLNLKNDKNGGTNTTILMTLFQNSTTFPKATNTLYRISPVLLINISDIESLSFPIQIIYSVEYKDKINSSHVVCGYWNERTHQWDENEADKYEGKTKNELFNCTYNHLTCFAMLVRAVDERHEAILDIFTQVGCYLSLIGLSLILTAFFLLRRWRDKTHDMKILSSLSFSLFAMYLLFLTGIDQSSVKELCIAIGASLHYFILSSFCWMLVVAFHNYLKFFKVIGTYIPRFMMKASLGAWIIPIIPIIVILSIDHNLYTDDRFCWVHSEGFYYGFLLPICFIWLLNVIVFIKILRNICVRQISANNVTKQSLIVSQIVLSLFLFIMLGLSWVFGFLAAAQISVVFSYLFCITTTTQGFLIFVFFVLIEKKAKDKWLKLIYPCFKSQEQISSYTQSRKTSDTEPTQQSELVSYSQQ